MPNASYRAILDRSVAAAKRLHVTQSPPKGGALLRHVKDSRRLHPCAPSLALTGGRGVRPGMLHAMYLALVSVLAGPGPLGEASQFLRA